MEVVKDWIEVTVQGWEKYNPRADRGNFAWFRMDNQFYLHMRQRKGVSAEATVVMGFLLAECSTAHGKNFKLRIGFMAEMLGLTVQKASKALDELTLSGDISFKPLDAASSLTGQDRTDEQDGQDSTQTGAHALPHLATLWNKHSETLAKVAACGATRKKHAEARWKEKPSTEYWTEVIARMARSAFCLGKNKTGWRADFDFLIKPDTHARVLEGKYDSLGAGAQQDFDINRILAAENGAAS